MSVEQNKAIMRRMIEEIWNKGNLMVADELFSADHFSPSAPDLPKGPESVKMLAQMFRSAMPDYHMNIDMLLADEKYTIMRVNPALPQVTRRPEFAYVGARIGEVPIIYVERREGQSKMSRGVILESVFVPWRLVLRHPAWRGRRG